jgi:general secretion pathway protein H
MPISVTGPSTDRLRRTQAPPGSRPRGFTLLELLVVVVIVGIIVTMFTLSVGTAGGTDRELRREARRLDDLVRLALEDASFQVRELGLRLYPDRYEFSVFLPNDPFDPEDDIWQPFEGQDVLAGRNLPPGFKFELDIEGRSVALERSAEQVARRYEPQLFILSSGDISDAFTVRIREPESGDAWQLDVAIDGTTEVARDED